MDATEIRGLLTRRPFQPFRVRSTGGGSYDVRNPALAVPMKSRLFIATTDSDDWTLVPYLYITAIETIGNGGHPGRPRNG